MRKPCTIPSATLFLQPKFFRVFGARTSSLYACPQGVLASVLVSLPNMAPRPPNKAKNAVSTPLGQP